MRELPKSYHRNVPRAYRDLTRARIPTRDEFLDDYKMRLLEQSIERNRLYYDAFEAFYSNNKAGRDSASEKKIKNHGLFLEHAEQKPEHVHCFDGYCYVYGRSPKLLKKSELATYLESIDSSLTISSIRQKSKPYRVQERFLNNPEDLAKEWRYVVRLKLVKQF